MKFSVLIPTRNRVEFLRFAIESVRRQDYADWQIVVSDNDSSDDTGDYARSLGDSRVRYVRTRSFVPVTENWNHALSSADGDYVVTLGDDDCLLPGYFTKLRALIEKHSSPELVYVQAVQFAYPDALPGNPSAFVQTGYCQFINGQRDAFFLAPSDARAAVEKSMGLRLACGYNMQHCLVSRQAVERLAPRGPFFQSPYPDYYATNVMLLTSRSVLVVPETLVAIGISPKSFGHFYFSGREAEGLALLNNMGESTIPPEVGRTLLPGNGLITCWYAAMACIERNYGRDYSVHVDRDRYRFLQVLYADRRAGLRLIRELWSRLSFEERLRYGSRRLFLFAVARVMPRAAEEILHRNGLFPRFDPRKRTVPYRTILELYESYAKIAG